MGFSGVMQAEGKPCGAMAKQPNTTMMDGEANHLITERPLPFQANFHPGMSSLTLVQPRAVLGSSPAENKHAVPAWCVSVCSGCSPAPVPWSSVVGDVQHRHCSAGPGRGICLPLQRACLRCVDEGVKDTLGRIKTMCVQAQKAYEVLLTCPALG